MKKLLYLLFVLLLIPLLSYAQKQKRTVDEFGYETIKFSNNVRYYYDGNPFNNNEEKLQLNIALSIIHPKQRLYINISKSDISPIKIEFIGTFEKGPDKGNKHSFPSLFSPEERFLEFEFIFDGDKSTYYKLTKSRVNEIKSLDDEFFLKLKKHKNAIVRVTEKLLDGSTILYKDHKLFLGGMTAGFNKFSGVKAPSIKNRKSYSVANGLANVNPFNLEKYIDKFILDAKTNHNVDLSYVNKRDRLIIFRELEGQTIAAAYKKDNDNEVLVLVDPENWYDANQAKRWYIIYHELGHDILNLKHGECGAMMNESTSGSYTWSRLEKDKNTMFNTYKKKK